MKRVVLVVAVGLLAVVAVVGVSAVADQRDAARRVGCQGNLTAIGTAMLEYHEKYGHFPPAFVPNKDGKPEHSWRVLLLEFLDAKTFDAYKLDEPWDGPNNRKLEAEMPNCYTCPADKGGEAKRQTNYFVVVGPKTVFPGTKTVKLEDIRRPRDATILVVEAVGQGVHWMEPKDLAFDSMSFVPNDPKKPSVSGNHVSPTVCTVDVSKLPVIDFAPEKLREMFLVTPEVKR